MGVRAMGTGGWEKVLVVCNWWCMYVFVFVVGVGMAYR